MLTARSGHEPLKTLRKWRGRDVIDDPAVRCICVRTELLRGAAEEAPGAYKDVDAVAGAAERAGFADRVALLPPRVCVWE